MTRLILNAPCMPKGYYHGGNAISQIASDVFFRYYTLTDTAHSYAYLFDSWNLHGLPAESGFRSASGREGTYDEILAFAQTQIAEAAREKALFTAITGQHILSYRDTDEDACRFMRDSFLQLADAGYIAVVGEECFLDIARIVHERAQDDLAAAFAPLMVWPASYHAALLTNHTHLDHLYPITKRRVFAPSVTYRGQTYTINPIFQSLTLPLFLHERYGVAYPAFLHVTGYGHSMLKWHYLAGLVSLALRGEMSYTRLYLHGSILGQDGKPMSKHGGNSVSPSDLFALRPDTQFVRYTLLRSIPITNKQIQIELATSEYDKLAGKVDLLKSGRFRVVNAEETAARAADVLALLGEFKLPRAIELLYVTLKKAQLEPADASAQPAQPVHQALRDLYRIFLSPVFVADDPV